MFFSSPITELFPPQRAGQYSAQFSSSDLASEAQVGAQKMARLVLTLGFVASHVVEEEVVLESGLPSQAEPEPCRLLSTPLVCPPRHPSPLLDRRPPLSDLST